jgi:hypothetical protein
MKFYTSYPVGIFDCKNNPLVVATVGADAGIFHVYSRDHISSPGEVLVNPIAGCSRPGILLVSSGGPHALVGGRRGEQRTPVIKSARLCRVPARESYWGSQSMSRLITAASASAEAPTHIAATLHVCTSWPPRPKTEMRPTQAKPSRPMRRRRTEGLYLARRRCNSRTGADGEAVPAFDGALYSWATSALRREDRRWNGLRRQRIAKWAPTMASRCTNPGVGRGGWKPTGSWPRKASANRTSRHDEGMNAGRIIYGEVAGQATERWRGRELGA